MAYCISSISAQSKKSNVFDSFSPVSCGSNGKLSLENFKIKLERLWLRSSWRRVRASGKRRVLAGISFRRYLKIRLKCLPHIFATSAKTMASLLASHTPTSSPVRGASVLASCATGWGRETTTGELSQQAEETPQHQLHVLQQQRLDGPRPSQWWQRNKNYWSHIFSGSQSR